MGRLVPLVLGALGLLQVLTVTAQQSPTCIPECSHQLRSQFAKFKCTNADDAACLCRQVNFFYGTRDCSKACQASEASVRQYLEANFCTGHPGLSNGAAASPSPASAASASSTPQPSSTHAPSSAAESTSSTHASDPSSTASSSASSAGAASTTDASSSASSATPSNTSAAAASATSSSAADPTGASLSQGSVVGIGIGVGAGVIALAGIVICLLLRSRKRMGRQSMEISKPLPGSGRTYATPDHGVYEKYGPDIEMTSNRYEDMVPRTQPRTLV
ncbi:hypothetical protein HIM_08146 [Hirsutella minnesotensis 3608]|uniref:CFEM domain-containing protein n=1 Tax=Hirsutella minnesotensis 3608 TaxID=1043627 RepID=A0A0F7ZYH4_9HYPO|nr:hypothetical protein HIM_08146 [Hirsutella minnesotensis 3608]